mmetsp:Transcript_29103/g.78035  ORF Transcript_29103/g.78035 Transcript_29103/m.78035 type:complete len:123 (-) Transcript_29103:33-401(-)
MPSLQKRELRRSSSSVISELGTPIPCDDHACSVSMPLWEHIEGYEEGKKAVHEKLALGYPRFVYHPYVVKVVDLFRSKHGLRDEQDALPFPNKEVADRCCKFVTEAIKRTMPELVSHASLVL